MSTKTSRSRKSRIGEEKSQSILAEIFFLLLFLMLLATTIYLIVHPSKVQEIHHQLYQVDSVPSPRPLPDKAEVSDHSWLNLQIMDMQESDLLNPSPPKLAPNTEVLPFNGGPYALLAEAHQAFIALANDFYENWGNTLYLGPGYPSPENPISAESKFAEPIQRELDSGLSGYLYIYQFEGMAFAQQESGRWALENAWRYGLINRFPPGMEDLTGQAYEAALLRYVGEPHARLMHEYQLSLEAYLSFLPPRHELKLDAWWLSRQNGESFLVPPNAGPVSYFRISEEELLIWAPLN